MANHETKLEVLISTMHQINHDILEKMNIQSDAIVINQCDKDEFEEFEYKGNTINFMSFAERGIGRSRNTALMLSNAKICLFADDDVVYVDDYGKIIVDAFKQNPKADMIIFNVPSINENRPSVNIEKRKRLRLYNSLRYGTYQIAIRRNIAIENGIYFSLLFGGGARYSAGEDSLFISDFIKKGFKIYSNPAIIGHVDHKDSTWFRGYTDKYFIDKGVFFYCLSKIWARPLCLQFVLRHHKLFEKEKGKIESLKLMFKGIKEFQ